MEQRTLKVKPSISKPLTALSLFSGFPPPSAYLYFRYPMALRVEDRICFWEKLFIQRKDPLASTFVYVKQEVVYSSIYPREALIFVK